MPSSYHENISLIAGILAERQPPRLLDIGPGHGKYGFLAREYNAGHRQLDACDAWLAELRFTGWDTFYLCDFLDLVFLPDDSYDLVLMIDVLEHFHTDAGRRAVELAMRISPVTLISTPHEPTPQGPVGGNPYEEHHSSWRLRDFDDWGVVDYSNRHSLIALLDRRERVTSPSTPSTKRSPMADEETQSEPVPSEPTEPEPTPDSGDDAE